MPMNTPADHLAADLMESYEQNGALAKAFDSQIAKLETKARELQRKKDKESILLTNTVFGMLRSTKLLRDRVLRAAKAKALKEQKEKKYLKDARLAAGYYMASVQMFKTLSVMNPKIPIDVYEKRGQFGVVFHDVFDEYMKEYRKVSERRFAEFSKSIGLEIKSFKASDKEGSEDWEVWSHSDKDTDDFALAAETTKQREAILQEWELVPGKDDETASQWEESDEGSELSDEAEPEPTKEKHPKKHHKDEKSKEEEPRDNKEDKESQEEKEHIKRKKTLADLKSNLPTSLGI